MRLAGKVILVTGSTTGIGRAIAARCAEEGARVIVHGRDRTRGQQVAGSLGDRAVLVIEDLADAEAPRRLIDAAVGAFGRLDGLVNNAAFVVRSDLYSTDAALFDRVIATNLRAPMLLIQAALPHLEAAGGCVLNIGSLNAYAGESNLLAYSISKGGLMTLSRNLSSVLYEHHKIRLNHFNVGWVLTENEYRYKIEDGLSPGWPERVPAEHIPSGRMTRPEEVAGAAVYWLSDESRPFNGIVIDLTQYPFLGRVVVREF